MKYLLITILFATCGLGLAADEEKKWTNSTELSTVWADGNAKSNTLGFKNDYAYKWDRAGLSIKLGGVRAESTSFTRTAVITADNLIVINQDEDTTKTAESYFLHSKFDRKISDHFFWFLGQDWDRNEFSGVRNRYATSAGLGRVFVDDDSFKFKVDLGFQYVSEDMVVEVADQKDSYGALTSSYSLYKKIGKSSGFSQDLKLVSNLDDSDDFRGDLLNSLSASLTTRLALKLSLQLLYDNQPAFANVLVVNGNEVIMDGAMVPYQLDELDTLFTASLVINF